jgi:hypothetical protein
LQDLSWWAQHGGVDHRHLFEETDYGTTIDAAVILAVIVRRRHRAHDATAILDVDAASIAVEHGSFDMRCRKITGLHAEPGSIYSKRN